MSRALHFLAVLLPALCFMHKAGATEYSYPEILIADVKHVVGSPARWEDAEWKQVGWASLAVVGTALVIDRPLRDEMRRHSGNSTFMTQVERFGVQYAAGVVGGFYLAGMLADDRRSLQVAQDGFAASLIASGIVTPAIKLVAGRSRPRDDRGVYTFKPFSNVNSSFPSGHTTEAFAVASVVANHYEESWVTCTAYSIAGLVGLARTYHHAHFASDVLAGAMIGTWVGKSVVARNQDLRPGKFSLLPDVSGGLIGIRITGSF